MIYGVIITPNAEQDLREAYPEAAGRWIKSARRSIKTLARNPGVARWPLKADLSRSLFVSCFVAQATGVLIAFCLSS